MHAEFKRPFAFYIMVLPVGFGLPFSVAIYSFGVNWFLIIFSPGLFFFRRLAHDKSACSFRGRGYPFSFVCLDGTLGGALSVLSGFPGSPF